jgi:VWFA-related protein
LFHPESGAAFPPGIDAVRRRHEAFAALVPPVLSSARAASIPRPDPQPQPSAPAPNGQPAAAQPAPTAPARSNVILLDVTVTDRAHNPIHHLKASDFQVRDAGEPQTIKVVDEHSSANFVPPPAMPSLPPGVFTNYTPAPVSGPINILLIDRLNTSPANQLFLNDQLIAFLHTMKPGTRVAIFGLTTQLLALQGLNADPPLLLAALETHKNLATQSTQPNTVPTPRPANDARISEVLADAKAAGDKSADTASAAETIDNVEQFEADLQPEITPTRVRTTLAAMNTLARYLSGLPGRKNLIWFSGSFPVSILPDGDLEAPFGPVAELEDQFRGATNLLSRAQVAVYPVDARGIRSSPVDSTALHTTRAARTPSGATRAETSFSEQNPTDHNTMLEMARETGGQAILNPTGLADAVAKAVDLGSNYYTVAYTPTESAADGKFHRIQLTLTPSASTPGVQLDYRLGYYADSPPRKQLTVSTAAPPTPEHQAIQSAMLRGAPDATQILFKVLAAPSGPPTDDAVAQGNIPAPTAKGPFRPYTINFAAAPQNLIFKPSTPGRYTAAIRFVVLVFDAQGALINGQENSVRATVDGQAIPSALKSGLQFHQLISVPATGDFFLRVAVHDLDDDHIGTVEVPVAAIRNLPVVESPSSKPAPPTLNNLPE